jgi:hypothetical protein
VQTIGPRARVKRKYKGEGPIVASYKNMKVHKVPLVCNLTDDDMETFFYQAWNVVEEVIHEVTSVGQATLETILQFWIQFWEKS